MCQHKFYLGLNPISILFISNQCFAKIKLSTKIYFFTHHKGFHWILFSVSKIFLLFLFDNFEKHVLRCEKVSSLLQKIMMSNQKMEFSKKQMFIDVFPRPFNTTCMYQYLVLMLDQSCLQCTVASSGLMKTILWLSTQSLNKMWLARLPSVYHERFSK